MNCSVRPYTPEDYPTLRTWYKKWDLPVTPESWIPKTSYVVENVCAGFLYRLGETPMYWIEGVITNPDVPSAERKVALNVLVDHFVGLQKTLPMEILMSSTPRESLLNIFQNHDFRNAPEKYNHVARLF